MNPAVYLCLAFLLPAGSIALDMLRDRADELAEAEVARLTAALPPARVELTPEDWPKPLSPLDLPGIGATAALAAVPLASRVLRAEPAPIVAELHVDGGRHRAGVAAGTTQQQARWNRTTGKFFALVEAGWSEDERETLSREWWCDSCLGDHRDCSGICACPCTLVEVAV